MFLLFKFTCVCVCRYQRPAVTILPSWWRWSSRVAWSLALSLESAASRWVASRPSGFSCDLTSVFQHTPSFLRAVARVNLGGRGAIRGDVRGGGLLLSVSRWLRVLLWRHRSLCAGLFREGRVCPLEIQWSLPWVSHFFIYKKGPQNSFHIIVIFSGWNLRS